VTCMACIYHDVHGFGMHTSLCMPPLSAFSLAQAVGYDQQR
jgi:hypothetical protein